MQRDRCAFVMVAALFLSACAGAVHAPSDVERNALAPTGSLRVGVYPGSPVSMVRDPKSGEARGISIEMGKALASRLHVPFQAVEFAKLTDVIDAIRDNRVDLIVTNATPARSQVIDFSDAAIEIEQGYLVLADSPLLSASQIDRPGTRVLVVQGSTSQGVLSRKLGNADIVVAPTINDAKAMLLRHAADAFATQKSILFEISDELAGTRVLDGSYGLEQIAPGVPKGREAALPYLRRFVDESKIDGSVARMIKGVGMRGTSVAHVP